MSPVEIVSIASALIAFASLFLVIIQLQQNTEQRKLESVVQIYDINQRLISLGFDKPELFSVLQGDPDADPVLQRHYLQLWLNQMAVIHHLKSRGLFSDETSTAFEADIADFISMGTMQAHWRRYRQFYPPSFRDFLDAYIPRPGDST